MIRLHERLLHSPQLFPLFLLTFIVNDQAQKELAETNFHIIEVVECIAPHLYV